MRNAPPSSASPSGCQKEPRPGSPRGGIATVPAPCPPQSMARLDLEELAEIGARTLSLVSLVLPSRREVQHRWVQGSLIRATSS